MNGSNGNSSGASGRITIARNGAALRWASVIGAGLLALTLTACGGSDEPIPEECKADCAGAVLDPGAPPKKAQ